LLVVTDHDTGRLVWAGKNRTVATLSRFIDDLGTERAAQLTHVSADGAEWIHTALVGQRAPNAVRCLDAFHVVAWAPRRWTRSAAPWSTGYATHQRTNNAHFEGAANQSRARATAR
jgi:transposase